MITGVSGSGKSTLAFDILFAEGQRRYLESLNAYARQFVQPAHRPDVDGVFGVPPTVAIEQRTSRGGRKSTVATLTEVYPFLRLLFVKLGTQHCPDCGVPIEPQTPESILARVLRDYRGRRVSMLAPLVISRKGYYTDLAAWAAAKGFAHLRVDGEPVPTRPWPRLDRFREHTIELPVGELVARPENERALRALLARGLDLGRGVVRIAHGTQAVTFSTRRACPRCGRSFEELDPRLFSYNSKQGWCPTCFGTGLELQGFDGEQTGEEVWWNDWWEGPERACPSCRGLRLRPEALAVRFRGKNIAEYARLTVSEMGAEVAGLSLAGREKEIARDIIPEIESRVAFLEQVGLAYLSLDRSAPTLSGGEAQRIRLASQLGSNLRGVCYILDEPTIGLHARDNLVLLETLHRLRKKGNTVVVVEHDEETIRRAEHIVDLGPGGGVNGGRLVAEGTIAQVLKSRTSLTAKFLREPLRHPLAGRDTRQAAGPPLCAADTGSDPAQPQGPRRVGSPGQAGLRDRSQRQRQEHAGPQPPLRKPAPPHRRPQAKGHAGGSPSWLRRDRGMAAGGQGPGGRPDPDREDPPVVPRHLRRHLGRGAPPVRLLPRGPHARLHGQQVLLQRLGRQVRRVRGPGHEAHRDELPARRERALRFLRREAVQRGDPCRHASGAGPSPRCSP